MCSLQVQRRGPGTAATCSARGGAPARLSITDVRNGRRLVGPHPRDERVEVGQLAGVGRPASGHQARVQRVRVTAHPHQPDRGAAQLVDPRGPAVRFPDLLRERGAQQHRAARRADRRAAAVSPPYSWTLTCASYQGPSRSPSGRPAAASVAAVNPP